MVGLIPHAMNLNSLRPGAPVIGVSRRLLVRRLAEADIPAVAALWADAQVTRFMGGPRKFEEVCASLRSDLIMPPDPYDLWPVVELGTETVVGHCGLLPKTVNGQKEIELVYVIAADHWGRGYATETAAAIRDHAFRDLGLPRLVSLIDPEHAASGRVALKLGMKYETDTVRSHGRTLRVYAMSAARTVA